MDPIVITGSPGSVIDDEEERRREQERLERERALEELAGEPSAAEVMSDAATAEPMREAGTFAERRPVTSGPYAGTGGLQGAGSSVRFPPGSPLPLAPRAQAIEERLDRGDRYAVERETREGAGVSAGDAEGDDEMPVTRPVAPQPSPPPAAPRKPPMPPPADMRDGLPTQSDIEGAERGDVARRILHAIASGISGGLGRSMPAFRSNADALRERQRTGLAEQRSLKRQAITDERAEQDRVADAESDAAQRALNERSVAARERSAAATAALATRRGEDLEHDWLRETQQRDPTSDHSAMMRDALVAAELERDRLLPRAQRRGEAAIRAEVDGWSAEVVQERMRRLRGLSQGVRGRAGGGSGVSGESLTSLRQEALRLGVPEAAARTMSPRQLTSEIAQRTRAGRGSEGEEILPGVRAGLGLERGEARRLRERFGESTEQYGALNEIDAIAQEFGGAGVIAPAAAARMTAPLTSLRAMVARMQNTGVINPSEAPTIEAMLPNPTSLSQMTFQTLNERLQSFRSALDRAVQSQLRTRGVSPEGQSRALGLLHGGDVEAPAERGEETVRVQGPDGTVRPIRRRTWDTTPPAQRRGFTVVP